VSALDTRVAISISPPEEAELARRGLSLDHIRHAYIELARQILARGGSLAYGGNPLTGNPNYVDILIALLRTYSKADRPAPERVTIYLAAPAWTDLDASKRAAIGVFATIKKVPAVEGVPLRAPLGDKSVGPHFTAMREAMTDGTDARIVIGGRIAEPFVGVWPGVVEEAYIALRDGDGLYVAGGLGGGAGLVADLIDGVPRPDAKLADEPRLREMFDGADLRNGLSDEDNALLRETADLDLIVALVLRGLETLCARRSS
jgi:hypothetical protein